MTLSEIQRDICEKIVILSYPLAFDAPVRGSRRNIGTPFGMEKLEWCRYLNLKNFEDMFIRFDVIHECDRRHWPLLVDSFRPSKSCAKIYFCYG